MIVWDQAKLARLADAIETCNQGETPAVYFTDGKRNEATHEWTLLEATSIYDRVKADLTAPRRIYPENREGEEP